MDIVIDFDGTVVTHDYPLVGSDIGAVPVLKELIENGHRLILFTMRCDKESCLLDNAEQMKENAAGGLTDAIMWFKEKGIELYGVQTNPDQSKWTTSPKAYGQIIIDDAALGCPLIHFKHKRPYVNWETVRFWLQEMQLIK